MNILHHLKLLLIGFAVVCFVVTAYVLAGLIVLVTLCTAGVAVIFSLTANALDNKPQLRGKRKRLRSVDKSRYNRSSRSKPEPS